MNHYQCILELLDHIEQSQILYHYSTKKLNKIYTLEKQIKLGISKENMEKSCSMFSERHNKYPYCQHISLFIDPIPLKLVREHFTENKVYQTNDYLYEHQIDIKQLKTNLKYYSLVENPINEFFAKAFWPIVTSSDTMYDLTKSIYFVSRNLINQLVNYQGDDYNKFKQMIFKFKGGTEKAFIDLVNSEKFKNSPTNKSMYAPSVPHLMIYPIDGELLVKNVTKKYFNKEYNNA